MAGLIVLRRHRSVRAVRGGQTVRIIPQARAGVVERLGRYSRTLQPGLTIVIPFVDKVKPLIDLREQVVSFPPNGVITEDNVDGQHRHRPLLHDHRPEGGDLRGRQPAAGDRAAHRHHAAKRDRRHDARGLADLAATRSTRSSRRPGRGDRQVGHPRQPRRAQGRRPAGVDPGGDGEADARRARPARRDPQRGGRQAVADPDRQGEKQSAILRAEGSGSRPILRAEGEAKAIETVFQAIHDGRPGPGAPELPVPADAPAARAGTANKIW